MKEFEEQIYIFRQNVFFTRMIEKIGPGYLLFFASYLLFMSINSGETNSIAQGLIRFGSNIFWFLLLIIVTTNAYFKAYKKNKFALRSIWVHILLFLGIVQTFRVLYFYFTEYSLEISRVPWYMADSESNKNIVIVVSIVFLVYVYIFLSLLINHIRIYTKHQKTNRTF